MKDALEWRSGSAIMGRGENRDRSKEGDRCCKKVDVPTEEELVALRAMRGIKERVREVKKRLSEIAFSREREHDEERLNLEKELEVLKGEWIEWEEKRKKAAGERMILLGHEEAP